MSDFLTTALVTLLVTVDPVGLAPIFISLTQGLGTRERRRIALSAAIIAFCILTFFVVAGKALLQALGIGLPAFRIAGGILLFWIAFEMVFERRTDRKKQTADVAREVDHVHYVAAFPLAIPLMAGPGAITAVILLSARAEGDVSTIAALLVLLAAVMAGCALVFMAAGRIAGLMGTTGNIVLSRLLGVVLAALAVQFVIDGIRALSVQ